MSFYEKLNSRSFIVILSILGLSWTAFFIGKLSESGLIQLIIFLTGFFLTYKGAKYRIFNKHS